MAKAGIRQLGVKTAIRRTETLRKVIAGQKKTEFGLMSKIVGDDIQTEIQTVKLKKHGSPGQSDLVRSIGNRARGTLVNVFTDLSIAVYGRIRELGGKITAFRSKFKRGKTGTPLLFIPLRKDVRPADWRFLTFGVDYVLTPSVKQKGSFFMRNSIRDRLAGRGATKPRLDKKLGFSLSRILRRGV